MSTIPVVDVFAGPGGLNEGFSSLLDKDGRPIFQTVNSFEMDQSAVNTLRLRAALRAIRRTTGSNPDSYYRFLRREISIQDLVSTDEFALAWKEADQEVRQLELGEKTRGQSDEILRRSLAMSSDEPWVLIGGPPCQAYSLAGRSRRTNDPTFAEDHKHVLYREYLHILRQHRPSVFVMENVKGMLSSRHDGGSIFQRIMDDLRHPSSDLRYELRSFLLSGNDPEPRDFILRAENHGVPQRRHRVIILGVREDCSLGAHQLLNTSPIITVAETIKELPRIRSAVSPRSTDREDLFTQYRDFALSTAGAKNKPVSSPPLGAPFIEMNQEGQGSTSLLDTWLRDERIGGVVQHESRAHMITDLMRYAYLAELAERGEFPKVNELPSELIPQHRNATRSDAPFADRFRVQRWDLPSTTVVSHISKDGHYYIHPDSHQMRSLTVREAARLQTFPDDYFFTGNRTHQYHQVGNAVPPLLARQLGVVVAALLGRVVGDGRV